jgi:aspartokinase
MDDQIGFGEAALRILHRSNVSFEHITTGQQDMTITLLQSEVDKIGEDALCSELTTKLKAKVDHFPISTVSIVSIGRAIGPALIGKIAIALSEIDIDFQFISKASGRSLTMGINRSEYDVVIRTLYDICVT